MKKCSSNLCIFYLYEVQKTAHMLNCMPVLEAVQLYIYWRSCGNPWCFGDKLKVSFSPMELAHQNLMVFLVGERTDKTWLRSSYASFAHQLCHSASSFHVSCNMPQSKGHLQWLLDHLMYTHSHGHCQNRCTVATSDQPFHQSLRLDTAFYVTFGVTTNPELSVALSSLDGNIWGRRKWPSRAMVQGKRFAMSS